MREFIIADNQDITKAGMMFLLSSQKDTALLLEADNKAELVQQLRLHPQAVVILDYTLFDFSGADELIVLHEKDDLLTPAERSVLKEIALGKTTKEIAAEKNLSFHTVNSHRKNIFRKLGVNNVHEATKYAMKAGIVDLVEYYI